MRTSQAAPRSDGEETRRALIEAAGQLAAERGWSAVTAKEVCSLAQVSTASVNYWFGSREALYEEVVREVPDGIVPESTLQVMRLAAQGKASPKAAIEQFFDEVLSGAEHPERWRLRLWARELFTGPSEVFLEHVGEAAQERMTVLRELFSCYLGVKSDASETTETIVSVVLPCLLCVVVPGPIKESLYPDIFSDLQASRETLKRVFMQNLKMRKRALERDDKDDKDDKADKPEKADKPAKSKGKSGKKKKTQA